MRHVKLINKWRYNWSDCKDQYSSIGEEHYLWMSINEQRMMLGQKAVSFRPPRVRMYYYRRISEACQLPLSPHLWNWSKLPAIFPLFFLFPDHKTRRAYNEPCILLRAVSKKYWLSRLSAKNFISSITRRWRLISIAFLTDRVRDIGRDIRHFLNTKWLDLVA